MSQDDWPPNSNGWTLQKINFVGLTHYATLFIYISCCRSMKTREEPCSLISICTSNTFFLFNSTLHIESQSCFHSCRNCDACTMMGRKHGATRSVRRTANRAISSRARLVEPECCGRTISSQHLPCKDFQRYKAM